MAQMIRVNRACCDDACQCLQTGLRIAGKPALPQREIPVEAIAADSLLECVILGFDLTGTLILSYRNPSPGTFFLQARSR
jgi:hypothetical protein